MAKENPFITSFGTINDETYIERIDEENKIIDDFNRQTSSSNAYMVAGVRGMGKTAFITHLTDKIVENNKEWIVVNLSSQNYLLRSLAANLQAHSVLNSKFVEMKLDFSLLGIGVSIQGGTKISDEEVMVRQMLTVVKKLNKKVLVTIDEASNQDNMRKFASSFQIYIRERLPIYLIMTGLYKNIRSLQSAKNMTFLKRTPRIDIGPLGLNSISKKYEKIIGVSFEEAVNLAKITKGYSYAYSLLGNIIWDSEDKKNDSKIVHELIDILEQRSYDQIWNELTDKEKEFLIYMAEAKNIDSDTVPVSEIVRRSNDSSALINEYRNRLIENGLIYAPKHGSIAFVLPFFDESINRLKLFG